MKVLAFTNLFPRASNRTLGTFNRDTFLALSRYCDIRVAAPTAAWNLLKRPGEILTPRSERDSGLEAVFLPFYSVPGAHFLHGCAMALSLRAPLDRLREQFPWDVIVAAWVYPDAVAAAHFSRWWNTPLITVGLGTDLNVLPTYFGLRPQIQWGLSRSSRVVTVSRALADRAIELGARSDRVVVQHNAVDGEAFKLRDRDEMRKKLGLDPRRPIIGYIGNHRKIKGTDVLVEAMDHLVHRLGKRDALLLLVGDGEITPELRRRATALGLDQNIKFCGRKLHDDVPLWMSALDVFCLPSRHEGCPNVVLEALASGRPVVATKVGGVPEILDERTGVLVPPEDPVALASGIDSALSRRWEPVVLRSSVRFLSWDAVAKRYHRMLEEAVAEWNGKEVPPPPRETVEPAPSRRPAPVFTHAHAR